MRELESTRRTPNLALVVRSPSKGSELAPPGLLQAVFKLEFQNLPPFHLQSIPQKTGYLVPLWSGLPLSHIISPGRGKGHRSLDNRELLRMVQFHT